MTQPNIDIPVRAPEETSVDDSVLPFEVGALDLRGRVVRLGTSVDEILSGHDYPEPVAKLLGEAVVLTVMLGSAIKDARLILQTQTDGPVRMLVVDYRQPGRDPGLRALRCRAGQDDDRRRPRRRPARCSAAAISP